MPPITRPAFDFAYYLQEAQICNIALGHIGAELIKDTDEDSKQSRACRAVYAQTRDELLRTYPFNFATKITMIPIDGNYESPIDEFSHAYKAEDWADFTVTPGTSATVVVPEVGTQADPLLITASILGREVTGTGIRAGTRVIGWTSNETGSGSITLDRAPTAVTVSPLSIHIPLLKVLEVAANDNNIYEMVGGGPSKRILCNVGDGEVLEMKYVEQVLDPDKFDSMFSHALALRIASKIAIDLTKNMAVVQMLQQEFGAIFQAAKVSSSEERQIDSPDPWWTDRQMGTTAPITRR